MDGTLSIPVGLSGSLAFLPGLTGTLGVPVGLTGTITQPAFTSWTADDSQRFRVEVRLEAVLSSTPPVDPGTDVVLLPQRSLTMPTPTLDAFGVPQQPWVPA